MKTLAISVKEREHVGKTNTRALRNQGNVPCVLYGGEKQVVFYAHENEFRKLVYTPDIFVVELNFENKKINAIMQDIQFHPVSEKILHIDFYQLFDDKAVSMDIPVKTLGAAPGVLNSGGVLSRNKRKLRLISINKILLLFILPPMICWVIILNCNKKTFATRIFFFFNSYFCINPCFIIINFI